MKVAIAPADLMEGLNGDPEFRLAARYLNANVELRIGDDKPYILSILDGEVVKVAREVGHPGRSILRISAPTSDWVKLLQSTPEPFYLDFYSASVHHGFRLTGDMDVLWAYYPALRRMPEALACDSKCGRSLRDVAIPARVANITGHYIYLTIDGLEYRVYYEEAGRGISVLLQHTAGSDGRQWRHLLEDSDLTADFRFIAPDLPYHGKSLPPVAKEWWKEEYALSLEFLMTFVITMAHALELERPIYMGCSMGGHLAADLALHYPGDFRAVIALEGAIDTHDEEPFSDHYYHPRVSSDFKGSMIYGEMAPGSPEALRRETAWMYTQGAPAVFKGDLQYYLGEHDLSETAREIDTSRTAVYVLSGEYDWSAYPERCRALAEAINGATYTLMKDVGHFAMCENPSKFKSYLLPVLEQIVAAEQSGSES